MILYNILAIFNKLKFNYYCVQCMNGVSFILSKLDNGFAGNEEE